MIQAKRLFNILPKYFLSITCFIAILYLTLMPDPVGDVSIPLFNGADKIIHSIMFGGQTLTLCIDMFRKQSYTPLSKRKIFYITLASSLFGTTIEYLQSIMQLGRSFEVADIFADFVGCIIVAALWKGCFEKKLKIILNQNG